MGDNMDRQEKINLAKRICKIPMDEIKEQYSLSELRKIYRTIFDEYASDDWNTNTIYIKIFEYKTNAGMVRG